MRINSQEEDNISNFKKALKKLTVFPYAETVDQEAYERQPYVAIVNELASQLKAVYGPAVFDFDIQHDDDCPALLSDGHCRCHPDVIARLDNMQGEIVGSYVGGLYKLDGATPESNL